PAVRPLLTLAAALAPLVPAAAPAQEVFAGAYVHGVDTPFTLYTGEDGTDIELGYRFAPIKALHALGSPSPYLIGSVNTVGDTSFAGIGLDWRFSLKGPLYIRPGVGVVGHDGPRYRVDHARHEATDLGSRALVALAVGTG